MVPTKKEKAQNMGCLVCFLFSFSADMFSLIFTITKMLPCFHFLSCFQSFVKEMVKTKATFFVINNENTSIENENKKQTKRPLRFLVWKKKSLHGTQNKCHQPLDHILHSGEYLMGH